MVESVISINSFSKTIASWDFKMIKMLNTLVEGPLLICYLEALDNNSDIDRNETLGHFIQFSICASIWFCPSKRETKTFDDFVSRVQNGIRFAWRKKLEN
nr:uncharacterized protein LOC108943982 [Nicotiana tomentosiformis]